jgi:DNA-directed RNA polymerase specialized sigma subunit
MEIKEELENYNNYLAEIKAKKYSIKKLELEEVTISGSNFSINGDIKPKGYMSSNVEKKVIDNTDKINRFKKEIEKLQAKIEMIEGFINILNDDHRRVIELRYKYNKSDLQISKIINLTKRAVNKRANIALKILEKQYNNKVYLKST